MESKYYWNNNLFMPGRLINRMFILWYALKWRVRYRATYLVFYFKLKKANDIVKKWASGFDKDLWIYIDFIEEDRFISEIIDERQVSIVKDSSKELAEFAIDEISASHGFNLLTGAYGQFRDIYI